MRFNRQPVLYILFLGMALIERLEITMLVELKNMTTRLPTYVTVPPHVLMQDFANEAVLLNLNTEHYYGLDEVGLRCWQLLTEDGNIAKIIEQLSAEYEVDPSQLKQDVATLLDRLAEANLIEVQSGKSA